MQTTMKHHPRERMGCISLCRNFNSKTG